MKTIIIVSFLTFTFFMVIKFLLALFSALLKKTENYSKHEMPNLIVIKTIIKEASTMDSGVVILKLYGAAAKEIYEKTDPVKEYLKFGMWSMVLDLFSGAIMTLEAQQKKQSSAIDKQIK